MGYKPIHCDSLLKRITKKDELFHGKYSIDPYQNCEFGCLYCDSAFDKTIYVKINAVKLLEKELELLEKGVIIVGSVHDPYQKTEEKYEITRNLLKTIKEYNFPCHILTKSLSVMRDLDLISSMSCMVTVSIISLDEKVSNLFEVNLPPSKERLQMVKTLSENGITAGVALIPILPYIVDNELEDIVKAAANSNAQYFLYKHLELKGDQTKIFKNMIQKHYSHLLSRYEELYKDNFEPGSNYISDVNEKLSKYCKEYNIPEKILL